MLLRNLLLLFLLSFAWTACGQEQVTLLEQVKQRKIPKEKLTIKIRKKARLLEVYYQEEKLVAYPCVFGFAPEGDKMQEGDGKTPEGNFGIRSMYPHRSWTYFIWIDYPNKTSWARFKKRKAAGTIGNKATIGGEIGIHGVPEGADDWIDQQTDWTLGCISLKTAAIKDLYQSISTKTKIVIVP
ncbi:MAG: hypothetical protein EP338_09700 [Bacteroidetes bacterium]|nr:MAG: hypothetical protein EP338_09700 [Bacteroidota bacterium]